MANEPPIRVLVVDDHDLFRDGIVGVLRAQPDIAVVGEAGDGLAALVLARSLRPDVILLDINMPGTDGVEAAGLISRELPTCRIVMLTMRDEDERVFGAIANGAVGYLLKTIRGQQLVELVRAAARGEPALSPTIAARLMHEFRRPTYAPPLPAAAYPSVDEPAAREPLTTREEQVLARIAAGRSDKEIAADLVISIYTVKAHVRSILAKLHVNNRREAARRGSGR